MRQLGKSDLLVSEIGIGTDMMGSSGFMDCQTALDLLRISLEEYGINFVDISDVAHHPGDSIDSIQERFYVLRKFLSERPDRRTRVILSCRLSCAWHGLTVDGRPCAQGLEKPLRENSIGEALDEILVSVGTDYVDILQLNFPARYVPRSELGEDTYCWGEEHEDDIGKQLELEMLNGLVKKGKARYVGLSNETPWGAFKSHRIARELSIPGAVSVQNLYNIMHRNEFESCGFPEVLSRSSLNIPLIAYGALAGGILTGKYLETERLNSKGPEFSLGQDQWDNFVPTYRGKTPEDYGYLLSGPGTGRANMFPATYHPHRSLWSQWLMGELIKLGREFGMTAAQLSLAWVYSRPFVGSTLIGPRTVGQLRDAVMALNYLVPTELEDAVHELFLRYRAPTMGGPHDSFFETTRPSSHAMAYQHGKGPIWSGGTHWKNFPLPPIEKRVEAVGGLEETKEVMAYASQFDDPTDEAADNLRLWKERLEEGIPGEYFAVKEQRLFGWDEKMLEGWNWRNMTETEKTSFSHFDWHYVYRNGQVYREKTTDAMHDFYSNKTAVLSLLSSALERQQHNLHNAEEHGNSRPTVFNVVDFDLIDKKLREKHGIDMLQNDTWSGIYNSTVGRLTEKEKLTFPFWYWNEGHSDDPRIEKRPGTFL